MMFSYTLILYNDFWLASQHEPALPPKCNGRSGPPKGSASCRPVRPAGLPPFSCCDVRVADGFFAVEKSILDLLRL